MVVRALIVLLACMNLGVAVWWAAHREQPRKVLPATEPGVTSLVLLSESERRSVPESAELTSDPQALDAGAQCLSLGPFETPADVRRAMNALLPKVERIQFREVEAVALRGYRVFLPAAGSRAQALEIARALSAQGISDYYVVTAGDQQNTVSLGIFRELANATKRHDTVAALGYNPTVEARTDQMPQWWIDLAAPAGFDWQASLPAATVKAVPTPCAGAPTAAPSTAIPQSPAPR